MEEAMTTLREAATAALEALRATAAPEQVFTGGAAAVAENGREITLSLYGPCFLGIFEMI